MIVTKIRPESVLMETILSNPTPVVSKTIEDNSASIPMNGKITMAKIYEIPKLCNASPWGLDKGSTNPE